MSEIRQRSKERPPNSNNTINKREEEKEQENFDPHELGAGLLAKSLIDSSPQQHGVVLKLHIPVFYSILPTCIQHFLLNFFPKLFDLCPSWKERYLILCGSYLYKYKNRSSSVPKGSPFDIESISVDIIHTDNNNNSDSTILSAIGQLPVGYTSIFVVSTVRRKHYYAVSNTEETMIWVRSINDARQDVITKNMGHATNIPYPPAWNYFDTLGKSLVKSKTRIKNRMEQYDQTQQSNHLEMTEFMGSRVSAPDDTYPSSNGYYS
mmetsp:Transcript_10129/g.10850  ORF Transcript_10129/g.10850 Transcript_10129/m.10850 type:complete len:264 (+) Transcript_10129:20-811(+)